MPSRELVWNRKAAQELQELLGRRSDRHGVLECIQEHLVTVAADPTKVLQPSASPAREMVYRFRCDDGLTVIYIVAVLAYAPNDRLAVLHCISQQF